MCQIKTWVFFIVYQKGDLVKQPMKKGSFVPKTIPGVRQGGGGHYSRQYHKECTYVKFNWIHFGKNDHIFNFLTVIYQQMTRPSDPDKCIDFWQNSLIINHVTYKSDFHCL